MELPNIHFQDFPIDFKQINPSDFPNFDVEDKIIIEPDTSGFINAELQSNINIYKKNTVVVNAAVGQGKTYSIIEIVKKYFDDEEDYIIFIASPFVSLVEQYYKKVIDVGIPQEQVYRYEWIGTRKDIDAWNSKVQIITANSLLGNSGEDSLVNSSAKRNYLNYLVRKCEENNRQVIFIYDEIHDAIGNFKEEYIFNLWKWRNVIHKNIILSATYNEASKIVIEYLAELTENKIQIIESKRILFPEKQSDLFLHFNPSKNYTYNDDAIMALVGKLIEQSKLIDILSYSKILAENICAKTDEGIGKLLFDAFGEIQECTSDLNNNVNEYRATPDNRYLDSKCNVGTNFKTGVSIEKENHAFIIILPPVGRKSNFKKNSYGIFTDGINSIIQAIARQRIKGEIHLILPPPDNFDYQTLPFDGDKLTSFESNFEICKNHKSEAITEYHTINSQNSILLDFYENTLLKEIEEEILYLNSIERIDKERLEYPSFKNFKLAKGEKYLATYYNFFGKDLSSFVTYCAFTNQFVNCNLKSINTKPVLYFEEERIQWTLEKYWSDYMGEDLYNSLFMNVSDKYKYFEIKNSIFKNYKVLLKYSNKEKPEEIVSFGDKLFETQFYAFMQRKFYPQNLRFRRSFVNNGFYIDREYSRGEYFMACVSHSNNLFSEIENQSSEVQELMRVYRKLNYFKQKIVESSLPITKNGIALRYVYNKPPENFIDESEMEDFISTYKILIKCDAFINKEVFEFRRAFDRTNEVPKQIKSFYTYLIKDFFISKDDFLYSGIEKTRIKIIKEIEIPDYNSVLDFISNSDITFPESYWESESKIRESEEFFKSSKASL